MTLLHKRCTRTSALAVSSPVLTQAGFRKLLLIFAVTLGTAGA